MATGMPLLLSAGAAESILFQECGLQGCPDLHNTLWAAQAAADVPCGSWAAAEQAMLRGNSACSLAECTRVSLIASGYPCRDGVSMSLAISPVMGKASADDGVFVAPAPGSVVGPLWYQGRCELSHIMLDPFWSHQGCKSR